MRVDIIGRRRENKGLDIMNKSNGDMNNQMMNPMMLNMYQQGNMLMGSGMYSNMMIPGMIGMASNDMMQNSGMDVMGGQSMDMSSMGGQAMAPLPSAPGGMTNPPLPPSGITHPPLPPGPGPMPTGQGMQPASLMPGGMSGTMNPQMDMSMMGGMGGMMMDPNIIGMGGVYGMGGGDMAVIQERKEIVHKHCKLVPPEPGVPPPPRRVKPPGCRTIFVGGLPENIKESVVREVFETYGRIHTLRLSKKNFCHIRYDRESSVEPAMFISGYRIKLTGGKDKDGENVNEDAKENSGWLHVDYALSRDDQNEFERKQRQALRIQQQQMQQLTAQQEMAKSMQLSPRAPRRRSPSPVRIQPYSSGAMVQLAEKIKMEDQFANALPTLIAWLERGECNKKNATNFYSMVQATNSHIRRLFNEKMQSEEEFQECKERVKNTIMKVIEQLEQVAKVFTAASHQRAWDHFTKPQRKNIETWQKMTQEFSTIKEEFNEKFGEDSEYNDGYNQTMQYDNDGSEEMQQVKRENESLRFQLEAYKNEVEVIKADTHKEMEKFKAQFIARQALQGVKLDDNKPPPPAMTEVKPPPPPPLPDDLDSKVKLKAQVEKGSGEARLIGIMAAFLQVHPQGASLDYVVSYVKALFPHTTQATIHHVLQSHGDAFQQKTTGIGANIEKRWSFIGFGAED